MDKKVTYKCMKCPNGGSISITGKGYVSIVGNGSITCGGCGSSSKTWQEVKK